MDRGGIRWADADSRTVVGVAGWPTDLLVVLLDTHQHRPLGRGDVVALERVVDDLLRIDEGLFRAVAELLEQQAEARGSIVELVEEPAQAMGLQERPVKPHSRVAHGVRGVARVLPFGHRPPRSRRCVAGPLCRPGLFQSSWVSSNWALTRTPGENTPAASCSSSGHGDTCIGPC